MRQIKETRVDYGDGAFTVYSFIYPKLINAYKLSCAVYTIMSASGPYTFPHMLPEVTPSVMYFLYGAKQY